MNIWPHLPAFCSTHSYVGLCTSFSSPMFSPSNLKVSSSPFWDLDYMAWGQLSDDFLVLVITLFFGLYFANTKDVAVVYRSFLSLLYIVLLWGLVIFCFIWQHVRNIMKINSRTLYKCFSDKIIFMEIQRANKFS